MKVFRITLDSNKYQGFLPEDQAIWNTSKLTMDCTSKLANWDPLPIYVKNPTGHLGSFQSLCSGAFTVDEQAYRTLRTVFEIAGEALPLRHGGRNYYLINVLECVDCLDREKTEWVVGKTTGAKILVAKYAFFSSRLSESTLFKIPETAKGEVLTVSGMKDPEDEFKSKVEHKGLKGIKFEEIWSA